MALSRSGLYGIYLGEGTTGNGHLILQVSSSNLINKGFKWALTNYHIAWFWWILLSEDKTCDICMSGRLVVLSRMIKAWNPQTIHLTNVTIYPYIPSRPFIRRCNTFTDEMTYLLQYSYYQKFTPSPMKFILQRILLILGNSYSGKYAKEGRTFFCSSLLFVIKNRRTSFVLHSSFKKNKTVKL